jgi:hypothetical protein
LSFKERIKNLIEKNNKHIKLNEVDIDEFIFLIKIFKRMIILKIELEKLKEDLAC